MPSKGANDSQLLEAIRRNAYPMIGTRSDYAPLLEAIGDTPIVLLGEATHGTHEFYTARAEITKRLIEEKGFTAIALEADWPDAHQIDRFIRSRDGASNLDEALDGFRRFPMWMWRNREFKSFTEWLWLHNRKESTVDRVGIYGVDLYSLYKSIDEVVRYLESVDPQVAEEARELYSCFDHYNEDPVRYGRFVRIGAQVSCEESAAKAASEIFARMVEQRNETSAKGAGQLAQDIRDEEEFFARRNAELIKNAESYYRNLFSPLVNTWNVRDRHMADTVDDLLAHLRVQGRAEKVVIWAHNSHIGDDAATEMGEHGQWNIGQLLRERHPGKTFHLGFTTYEGFVTAASEWDHPPRLKQVRPALPGSYEDLLHRTELGNFLLDLRESDLAQELAETRLERAIGVIYAPETERSSHYFHARLSEQFDAVIHFDRTTAVDPLDTSPVEETAEPSIVQY